VSDAAIAAMSALCKAPADGYTPFLQNVTAEQTRKRVEENYVPPSLEAIRTVVSDAAPTTVADLQAMMIEELSMVQAKLDGHPADWRKRFFDGSGKPSKEEACRDEILKMIGEYPLGVLCAPEGHLADDNRADIQCTIGELMLPIEVKGQWHKELWTAAETQLDRKYASDWRADRRGIYLVLWFGREVSKNKQPRAQRKGKRRPKEAADLAAGLRTALPIVLRNHIEIVVLDLTHPSTR